MSPRRREQIDPLERAMESVLAPGSFISYESAWSFVDDVQAVADDVDKLIESEPERAGRLYETFIAACHEKAEGIDDSSGYFGMLVEDLFRGWIEARQTAGIDSDETAKSLLAWMEDDPYDFCYHLHGEAVKVLDREGLDAFARQARGSREPRSPATTKRSVSRTTPAADGEGCSRRFSPRNATLTPTSRCQDYPNSG